MRKSPQQFVVLLMSILILSVAAAHAQTPASSEANWQAKLRQMLPLLGHRNWILIVDSAYPLQTTPGVETIETGSDEIHVVRDVLNAIDHSIQVRPIVYMDAELPFVPERDAPGVTEYRRQIKAVLGDRAVHSTPHDHLLRNVDDIGKSFKIVILKTNLTIPYTSVFLQLDCKYWSADAEARLRSAMKQGAAGHP